MTSKDRGKYFKDKLVCASNDSPDLYSNFTLNKNHKCATTFDHGRSNNTEIQKIKSSNYDAKKETKARNSSSCNKSSSTLSLHIAAYENFIEAQAADSFVEKELKKKGTTITASEDSSQQFAGTSFNDKLEFPRQQEDKPTPPEVQQFTASQRLFTPIQEPFTSSLVPKPRIARISGMRETKNEKLTISIRNISTAAPNDLIKQLFQHFGRIDEFQVYPILVTAQTAQKVAYVRYEKEKSVLVAQHLTNTVFYDRAIICVPTTTNTIPDEETALLDTVGIGKRVLPSHVVNKVEENEHGQKMLYTTDPTLTNLGLLPYPPLGADLDPEIVEQTRRTLYVGNLKKNVDPDDVVKFFNTIGEVMYLRMANINEHHSCAYAYVEFTNQTSIPQALQNDGVEFQGQPIRIQHSRVAIVKPQQKTNDQAMEEIEEAIRRRDKGEPSPHRKATRSPSPRRSRRRSRTPPRRSSRSRSPRRERDRDRDSRKRDDRRDRDKDRDRRDRKDERSRKDERESRKDRDKEKEKERRRSKSPRNDKEEKREREKDKKEKERRISKSPVKEKEREKEKEKSVEKASRSKDREREKEKKEKERRRSRSPRKEKDEKKERSKEKKERRRSRSRSPVKDDKRERDNKEKKEKGDEKPRDSERSKDRERDKKDKDRHSSSSRSRRNEKSRGKNSDTDEPMPLAKEEMSIRERLLAKQKKKSRTSDEMDISD